MKKINYDELEQIVVKSQVELDDIPFEFKGKIYIKFGTCLNPAIVNNRYRMGVVARGNSSVEAYDNSSVVARGNSSVVACGNSSVVACGNSSVVARGNSSVEAYDNSSVVAWDNSSVVAWDNSSVEAWDNSSVVAWDNSSVVAWDNSSVEAWDNSPVVAYDNSSVVAYDNSSVVAWDNSSVEARGNSSVVAYDNSSVVAWDNSSVEAWDNSSVVAYDNSSVIAYGNSSVVARGNSSVVAYVNSSVEACGNAQIVDRLSGGKINVTGNARIVYMPKTIDEYCSFHNITRTKKLGKFFKCVHKDDAGRYWSNYDRSYEYIIGKIAKPDSFDENIQENCGHGIHVSHLNYALNFGRLWSDLSIIEVQVNLDDIIIPDNCPEIIRCKKVKVLREVPLDECGLYGKILARRKEK